MNTASAVFHLRAGIPVFYLFLGPVIILFCGWMAVREAGLGIRSRTCEPWAWAAFAVCSIAVLLGVAGLNLRIAAVVAVPALLLTAVLQWADRRDPQALTKRVAARRQERRS